VLGHRPSAAWRHAAARPPRPAPRAPAGLAGQRPRPPRRGGDRPPAFSVQCSSGTVLHGGTGDAAHADANADTYRPRTMDLWTDELASHFLHYLWTGQIVDEMSLCINVGGPRRRGCLSVKISGWVETSRTGRGRRSSGPALGTGRGVAGAVRGAPREAQSSAPRSPHGGSAVSPSITVTHRAGCDLLASVMTAASRPENICGGRRIPVEANMSGTERWQRVHRLAAAIRQGASPKLLYMDL
jgi:hypothetical protein